MHFKSAVTKLGNASSNNALVAYYANGNIQIKNLTEIDIHSKISIYDVQGRLIKKAFISNYPTMVMPVDLVNGGYIIQVNGQRTEILKRIKYE